jgi:hypothetical protein
MAANGILEFQGTNQVIFPGASSNIVLDTVTASLGIGVDVNGPSSNLHVVGNAYVSSNLTVGNAYVSSNLTVAEDINFLGNIRKNGVIQALSGGGGQWAVVNTNDIHYSSGNVGIGTTTAGYDLDVNGDINFTGILTQNGSAYGGSGGSTTFSTDGVKVYYTDGPVGIANVSALTTQTLQIGGNVAVNDVANDKLSVTGNVYVSKSLTAVDLLQAYEVRANFFTVKNIDIKAERPRKGDVIN